MTLNLRCALIVSALVLLSGCSLVHRQGDAGAIPPQSHYVAMGSSFAAGPGIDALEEGSPPRCTRSVSNYAHQLARRRLLRLTDVTCSGATTEHVLERWREMPAQLDALQPDTRLVTLTIGGNDLRFMSGLIGASCVSRGLQARFPAGLCNRPRAPDEAMYIDLESRLQKIVHEIRQRSPRATVVFVEYATVLPKSGSCERMPLKDSDLKTLRVIDSRLRALTRSVARQTGSQVLKAGVLTRDHHVCAPDPWVNGFASTDQQKFNSVYHPTRAGMAAVAEALGRLLRP